MIRRGIFGVVVLASLASGFQSARAQDWTNMVADSARAGTPYFLDTSVGFLFTAGMNSASGVSLNETNGSPSLEKTTNGGGTWHYLPFFDSIGCSITQLCFISLEHGYASTSYGSNITNSGGVYETTDQGNSWKRITPRGLAFTGVYASGGIIFASEALTRAIANGTYFYGWTGEILYSHDDGATWDSITNVAGIPRNRSPQFQLIYGNRDSLVATVYFDDSSYVNGGENTYLVYSTDLGQSWQSTFLDSEYQYSIVTLHISPHTCSILRLYEDSTDYYSYLCSFLQAIPPYTIWEPGLLDFPTGSWTAGNACALYIAEYEKRNPKPAPLRRSLDNGSIWTGIDSLELPWDEFLGIDFNSWQNLSVVGYGAVVYATNVFDSLIKTTDGGDGALSVSMLAPRLIFIRDSFPSGTDTLSMTECSPTPMFFYYQNLSCAITTLDSVSIDGLDPSEYSWTATNHNDCLSLPDTVYVLLKPNDTGTYPITVNAHFVDDEFQTMDEQTSFTLQVAPGPQPVTLGVNVNPVTIVTTPGDTIDIPVYLTGTVSLDSVLLTLPFGLDTNMLRPIGFHSIIEGLTSGNLSYVNGTVIVPLQAVNLSLNGQIEIGYFQCVVYLSDTLQTSVTFSSASLTAVNAPCVALSLSTDSVNIVISGCGFQTLMQLMKNDSIAIAILSIVPNPAATTMEIAFSKVPSSPISYQVVDALGETRMNGVTASNAISLDISSLPQGVYYFRATSAEGTQTGKQFVIMR